MTDREMISFTGLGKHENDDKSFVEGVQSEDGKENLDPLTVKAMEKMKQNNTNETDSEKKARHRKELADLRKLHRD